MNRLDLINSLLAEPRSEGQIPVDQAAFQDVSLAGSAVETDENDTKTAKSKAELFAAALQALGHQIDGRGTQLYIDDATAQEQEEAAVQLAGGAVKREAGDIEGTKLAGILSGSESYSPEDDKARAGTASSVHFDRGEKKYSLLAENEKTLSRDYGDNTEIAQA